MSVGVVDGTWAESTCGQATGGRVGWSQTPAMLAGSTLDLLDGLVTQSTGGCGGRITASPGSTGVRLTGW